MSASPPWAHLNADRLTPYERSLLRWGKREEKREGKGGVFLEGEKLAQVALEHRLILKWGWFSSLFAEQHSDLISLIQATGCFIRPVSQRVMRLLSEMETPPGLALVGVQPEVNSPQAVTSTQLNVFLPQIQDPGNLGAVIRTAEFLGVCGVWVGGGSVDPYSPKVIRGSMGAVLHFPVYRVNDTENWLKEMARNGFTIWAAHIEGEPLSLCRPTGRDLLLFGSESQGLTSSFICQSHRTVTIPRRGSGDSLNLAVAASIFLYHFVSHFSYSPLKD